VGYFGGRAAASVLAEAGIVAAALLVATVLGGLAYVNYRERRRRVGR